MITGKTKTMKIDVYTIQVAPQVFQLEISVDNRRVQPFVANTDAILDLAEQLKMIGEAAQKDIRICTSTRMDRKP
jgi:hypothetical protein